jgi:hypothetical protein
MKLIKWPLNLAIQRAILATCLIFSLTLATVMLSAFIDSTSILIVCAFSVNSILFGLSLMIAQWKNLINSKSVLIMTPTQEQFATSREFRKQLEKEYQLVRQDINKSMG